ncbi:hypothetical protein CPC08DRAFT_655423 [Agrocybe pediades]|nr:hypothetical protein CPC08DRAFT_655423 [Agrocybe pediades]
MASHKSPLRDRLLSNSPDPIKSSILRESGMGWNSPTTNPIPSSGSADSITSPLRIAKRESPTRPTVPAVGLARRTSSSYRHVHTNNLVSKSPFKSQIPTSLTSTTRPSSVSFPTRRVSGEKRSRPSSMYDQAEAENDRPLALKRDRKQSKAFQGLLEKEPVTKSPFRSQTLPVRPSPVPIGEPKVATSAPEVPTLKQSIDATPLSTTPPTSSHMSAPPAAPSGGPSPGRSSLVSRRMHGPRLSGGSRRERRKTVTFHERCDVLEFDRDDAEDEVFESASEDGQDDSSRVTQPDVLSPEHSDQPEVVMDDDTSYESIQLSDDGFQPPGPSLLSDPDASITGIVEEMFFNTNAANFLSDVSATSTNMSTPPRHNSMPTDLETEDGVPLGRSHHIDRFLQHHHQHSPHAQPPHFSPRSSPAQGPLHSPSTHPQAYNLPTHASPHGPPATPPRRSPATRHSTPPLGRSTHIERILQAREEEREREADADAVEKLPPSPSPMKKKTLGHAFTEESLIPKFDLDAGVPSESDIDRSINIPIDPFAARIQDEFILSDVTSQGNPDTTVESNDDADASHVAPEMLQDLDSPTQQDVGLDDERERTPSLTDSLSTIPERVASPASRSASPLLTGNHPVHSLGKIASRERISREEVQRRLQNQRSPGSPMSDPVGRRHTPSPSIFVDVPNSPYMQHSTPDDSQEKDSMSVLTSQTDFSTETAVVETVEKRLMGLSVLTPAEEKDVESEFGVYNPSQKLQFDFGSKFSIGGLGLGKSDYHDLDLTEHQGSRETQLNRSPRANSIDSGGSGIKMGDVDVDMDMKSALDRLMEDVAGAGARADESMMTDDYDDYEDPSVSQDDVDLQSISSRPKVIERAATDSALLQHNEADGVISRSVSTTSSASMPPPPPPKDNIKTREQMILEKRREARRLEEEGEDELRALRGKDQQRLGVGRPSRRRSMSTSDAEVLGGGAKKRGDALLDVGSKVVTDDDPLADSIEKELQKLVEPPKKSKYHVREREGTIYASSSEEKVSHMAGPGDVDSGRAWRMVRRPSDMNEYAKQIKEYRAQDKGKAYGKVFVKVLGVKGMHLPLPHEPTAFTCTLNNGIHFVTTPECQLKPDCRIEQEFELIEHSKLEFTLTLKVRRDPHIISQFKAVAPPAPAAVPMPIPRPAPVVQTASRSGGMRSFFSSSPRKSSKDKVLTQPPPPPLVHHQPVQRLPENLARHLKPDGTLARAFISFKDIASRCDTRLFETNYPLIGQRVELGGKFSTLEVGQIVLQIFRLPPLPGIPQDQLPQSLEECHRGLRHINWHKMTYFQGTLTQIGGDCSTWRRRQLRVIGANLVAFNDVTKKATATIDLKKAIAVEDDQNAKSSSGDEYDGLYGVERSFRLIFPQDQEIVFFADSDEEKAKWLEVLRALVGRIPPHPLWAELLWQRQEEITKRMAAAQQPNHQTSHSDYSR